MNVELLSKFFFFGIVCLNGDLICWFVREVGFGERNIIEEGVRASYREEFLNVKSYFIYSNYILYILRLVSIYIYI